MQILVQKGQNGPYYVPVPKQAQVMKEYLLSDRIADLAFLMTSGLKPEYYIRKRNFFLPSSKWLKNDPYPVSPFLYIIYFISIFFMISFLLLLLYIGIVIILTHDYIVRLTSFFDHRIIVFSY